MSGFWVIVIRLNETIPASIRPTNSTIGPTGFRMHHDEILRKFMSEKRPGARSGTIATEWLRCTDCGCSRQIDYLEERAAAHRGPSGSVDGHAGI
jgi:hypothetical protein